jgi:hypothetical protein
MATYAQGQSSRPTYSDFRQQHSDQYYDEQRERRKRERAAQNAKTAARKAASKAAHDAKMAKRAAAAQRDEDYGREVDMTVLKAQHAQDLQAARLGQDVSLAEFQAGQQRLRAQDQYGYARSLAQDAFGYATAGREQVGQIANEAMLKGFDQAKLMQERGFGQEDRTIDKRAGIAAGVAETSVENANLTMERMAEIAAEVAALDNTNVTGRDAILNQYRKQQLVDMFELEGQQLAETTAREYKYSKLEGEDDAVFKERMIDYTAKVADATREKIDAAKALGIIVSNDYAMGAARMLHTEQRIANGEVRLTEDDVEELKKIKRKRGRFKRDPELSDTARAAKLEKVNSEEFAIYANAETIPAHERALAVADDVAGSTANVEGAIWKRNRDGELELISEPVDPAEQQKAALEIAKLETDAATAEAERGEKAEDQEQAVKDKRVADKKEEIATYDAVLDQQQKYLENHTEVRLVPVDPNDEDTEYDEKTFYTDKLGNDTPYSKAMIDAREAYPAGDRPLTIAQEDQIAAHQQAVAAEEARWAEAENTPVPHVPTIPGMGAAGPTVMGAMMGGPAPEGFDPNAPPPEVSLPEPPPTLGPVPRRQADLTEKGYVAEKDKPTRPTMQEMSEAPLRKKGDKPKDGEVYRDVVEVDFLGADGKVHTEQKAVIVQWDARHKRFWEVGTEEGLEDFKPPNEVSTMHDPVGPYVTNPQNPAFYRGH